MANDTAARQRHARARLNVSGTARRADRMGFRFRVGIGPDGKPEYRLIGNGRWWSGRVDTCACRGSLEVVAAYLDGFRDGPGWAEQVG